MNIDELQRQSDFLNILINELKRQKLKIDKKLKLKKLLSKIRKEN